MFFLYKCDVNFVYLIQKTVFFLQKNPLLRTSFVKLFTMSSLIFQNLSESAQVLLNQKGYLNRSSTMSHQLATYANCHIWQK